MLPSPPMNHRQLKQQTLTLLQADDWRAALDALCALPARRIVNPLFGLLYHGEPLIRWRAVSALGAVVSQLADAEIEAARVIMRRLMWNLNDESGGIGWGSPESLGEITARHARLAKEFGCILISYADPTGNYLEHPSLQEGVLWGWGRLGHQRPDLIRPAACLLTPYLLSDNPALQGLAAWAAVPLQAKPLRDALKSLTSCSDEVPLYIDHEFQTHTIGRLARLALA